MTKATRRWPKLLILAEQEGFEPSKRYNRLPDFESYPRCLHSVPRPVRANGGSRFYCLDCAVSGGISPTPPAPITPATSASTSAAW